MSFWSFANESKRKAATQGPPPSCITTPPSSDSSKLMPPTVPRPTPLQHQHPSDASPATKIRHAILATAIVDALGGPVEFQARFSFETVTTMIPNDNFSLPPGVWTDDTSMTLCLARSLAHSVDGFSERDQLRAYLAWNQQGELSAIGRCFDIGGATSHALSMFQTHQNQTTEKILQIIKINMDGDTFGGNGSLMRVLPIGLAYWRDENQARVYAGRSSCTTHPNSLCVEACEVWTTAVVKIMQAAGSKNELSKLDILEHFALYPYSTSKLRQALTIPVSVVPLSEGVDPAEKEDYYWLHHPLLQKIAAVSKQDMSTEAPELPYPMPSAEDVPSTGYVLHSLVAALYCFMSTQTFEEGALMAVNMGSDADTVGAIYGGLAGVWYAETKTSDRFWSPRVLKWKKALVKRGLVEQVADELVAFSESLAKDS